MYVKVLRFHGIIQTYRGSQRSSIHCKILAQLHGRHGAHASCLACVLANIVGRHYFFLTIPPPFKHCVYICVQCTCAQCGKDMCVYRLMPQSICGGQRTVCGWPFCLSTICVWRWNSGWQQLSSLSSFSGPAFHCKDEEIRVQSVQNLYPGNPGWLDFICIILI